MTFGEKVREARKKLNISQDDLSNKIGVSRRTVTSWETDKSFPRTRKVYEKLAETLDVPLNYLLSEDDAFVMDASEQFGYRGKKGAEKLVQELTGLFAGGELAEEDMDALAFAVQEAYVEAKKRNKKYTPKKYRQDASDEK
ncbi:helix-turn-helix domain-containing protein [Clostridium vitabionis]|uniref:helix-turn-helix domain-containing protein n=1 Tax=Clostridium vitabionis TaxID=2784388 RepID=UPI00188B52AF|nr:helix-turn-helix transcriptional regulator [Clostridium vitabionis]